MNTRHMVRTGIVFVGVLFVLIGGKMAHAEVLSPLLIGEVAWAGSSLSTSDEWIELWNTSSTPFDASGWALHGAGESNKTIVLPSGSIVPALGTFIIANYASGDARSSLTIEPQVVTTTISLSNTSFAIDLIDPTGTIIDTTGSGEPPAGASLPIKTSMIHERDAWISATTTQHLKTGITDLATPGICDLCGLDFGIESDFVADLPADIPTSTIEMVEETPATVITTTEIMAAPALENLPASTSSVSTLQPTAYSLQPTPPPKPAYGLLRLNEVVAAPKTGKEWIEVTTLDAGNAIALDGCTIHDSAGKILTISKATLDPASSRFAVLQLSSSRLNNSGDSVSLYDPSGQLLDTMTFGESTKGSSWIRHPDVTGDWQESLQPTPGLANVFVAPEAEEEEEPESEETIEEEAVAQETDDAAEDAVGAHGDAPSTESATASDATSPVKKITTTTKKTAATKKTTTPKPSTIIHPITFDMLSDEGLTALRVLLHGTVATPPGFFSNRTFVLQSPDGRGILVTTPVNQRLPEFGSAISAVGTIKFSAANVPSLQIGAKDRWTTSGTSTASVVPRLVDLLAPSTEDAWSLMHVTGTVIDVRGKTIHLDMEDAEIDIVIRPGVNYRAERLKAKDVIAVSGVLDTTTDVARLLPRHAGEIRLVSHAPEPSAQINAAPQKQSMPNWMPIGAAGGAIAITEGAKRLHRRHKQKKLEKLAAKMH